MNSPQKMIPHKTHSQLW